VAKKLFLQFNVDGQRFAIATDLVKEITSMVKLTRVPKTEAWIAGLFNYRGSMLPVIDISRLLFNSEHQLRICTRIIILETTINNNKQNIGLIVEQANKTLSYDINDLTEHKLSDRQASYVGKILHDEDGEIQLIDIDKLIPTEQINLQVAVNAC